MKRIIQLCVGLAVGIGLLWFLFRGTNWHDFFAALQQMRMGWFIVAILLLVVSMFIRVWRWTYIVRPVDPEVSFRTLFNATQIGFLANFVLPARIGEFIRAVVLAKRSKASISQGFALVTLDRVTDLFGLMGTMAVALLAFRPDHNICIPGQTFGREDDIIVTASLMRSGAIGSSVFFFGVVAVLVLLFLNQRLALRLNDAIVGVVSKRLAHWSHHLLEQFAQGLSVFRSGGAMIASIVVSLFLWAVFLIDFVCFLEAFDLDWPWYAPFVIQAVLAIVISVPGTPGLR